MVSSRGSNESGRQLRRPYCTSAKTSTPVTAARRQHPVRNWPQAGQPLEIDWALERCATMLTQDLWLAASEHRNADNEPFRHLRVEICGRFRAGSYDHASAWRLLDGVFGWRLDVGGERRRVRPGPSRKGWTAGTGCTASPAACNGPSGSAASHGASRRAGIPSPGHAAAAGHGAASRAALRLSTAASGPPLRCNAATRCPASGCAAA